MDDAGQSCVTCGQMGGLQMWGGALIGACAVTGRHVDGDAPACAQHTPASVGRVFDGRGVPMDGRREAGDSVPAGES